MKVFKMGLWVAILTGPLFGHTASVASLLLAVSYILYLTQSKDSWVQSSKYWEETALSWHGFYMDLVKSHPEDVRNAVESYQIDEVIKEKR